MKLYLKNLGTHYTKNNTKWIIDLKHNIKLLEKNHRRNLPDIELRRFLDFSPKAQSIKGKNDKFDFIKI